MQHFDIEELTLVSVAICAATTLRFDFPKTPNAWHFAPAKRFRTQKGTLQ